MGTKDERRAAREAVAAYHEARLAELVARVAEAVDHHRAGELDAFEVDEVLHQYHRATRKLWTFCEPSGAQAELTARVIRRMADEGEAIDWWERGAARRGG
ncbi:hypothetical protein AB0J40_13165 [Amycolatopsis sp. NPDC049691]|uniref:hypothetical protein n=1 Tax=Amycolatopsis sp. NPDC049691 TaxID=3155155 RepID=UPI00343E7EA6